jgi:hypothetical protein
MKKKIILAAILAFVSNSFAQISINSSDIAVVNDTAMISISTQYSEIDFITTGENQIWDFTYLVATEQQIDTFYDVGDASITYQFIYNNAFTEPDYLSNYYNSYVGSLPAIPGGAISIESPVFFTKNSSSASIITGLGLELNGNQIPAKADTVDTLYHFPMTYEDNWYSRSYLLIDMNPAFDAKFKRHQQRTTIVDGWGEITTDFGTFDAIRVKSTISYQDSIYFDITGQGNPSWFPLPTPQDVEYTWWSNNNKVPLLKINTQNNEATLIEYKDHEVVIGASINENDFEFNMFPNPVENSLTVTGLAVNSIVEIINASGKVQLVQIVDNSNQNFNISDFPKGIYIVKITSDKMVSTQKLIKQ